MNKAKGHYGFFPFLEPSSLPCSKKSFSHRLLEVICGRDGIIWEYHQSYKLRDRDGVQLWCCPDKMGNPLLRADWWIQVEITPLRIPQFQSVLNTFYSTKIWFSPTNLFCVQMTLLALLSACCLQNYIHVLFGVSAKRQHTQEKLRFS